ncbi:hypothetical protein, partial [Nonomuraea zeae]
EGSRSGRPHVTSIFPHGHQGDERVQTRTPLPWTLTAATAPLLPFHASSLVVDRLGFTGSCPAFVVYSGTSVVLIFTAVILFALGELARNRPELMEACHRALNGDHQRHQ